jgi:8-oxo-dGTP diphosphatase
MPDPPRLRPAVRAVLTDPDRRILLVHFMFPWEDSLPTGLWACPGGGINPSESPIEALVRELREELGLEIGDPGSPIWRTERVFAMERWDGQRDTYFWLEVEPFEPQPHLSEQQLLDEYVDAMRWWTYDELHAAQRAYDEDRRHDTGHAVFSPRRLGHLVSDLLAQGRPAEMLHLDPL